MEQTLASMVLADVADQFRQLKKLADRALATVEEKDLWAELRQVPARQHEPAPAELSPGSNSIGTLVQHMAGNLRSRWTDFLSTDGEKPDRDRDAEFEASHGTSREALLARWEEGWSCLFAALAALAPEDLRKTVLIRAEPHSVPRAIHRQLTHQAYHVGQLVLLAKHFAGPRWESLSVPRGKSREFNEKMFARQAPK